MSAKTTSIDDGEPRGREDFSGMCESVCTADLEEEMRRRQELEEERRRHEEELAQARAALEAERRRDEQARCLFARILSNIFMFLYFFKIFCFSLDVQSSTHARKRAYVMFIQIPIVEVLSLHIFMHFQTFEF